MPTKRPPTDEDPGSTIVSDDSEDQINTGQRRAPPPRAPAPRAPPPRAAAAEPPANDGATAFVRVDQLGAMPAPSPAPASDEAAGATAFVRVDQLGNLPPPPPPRRAPEPAPSAPRKGLQVTLPDEEPAPPPPPKRVIAQPALDKKGRRGNWWDAEADKIPDEPPPPPPPPEPPPPEPEPEPEDDGSGATAFVRVAPKPKPAPPPPEPEVQYRPVPASDYQGHVAAGPPKWKTWARRGVGLGLLFGFLGLAAIIGAYVYISKEIPTFDSIRDYHPFVASKVVASDGTVVGQFFRERRTVVKMDQIPRVLVQAVVSAEDKDFYKHPGFNVIALARAVVVDALSGRKRLGASTITQQVVKNFFLTSEKHWKRKLKELVLAARLERNLSKDDILFLYLNHINFGKAHYGVEEASLYYFNKHVQDIDLGEAAILAGLPQNPARINPRRHPDRAKTRQTYVLNRMLANKLITQEERDHEVEKPIVLPPAPADPPGAWYLDEVRRQLVAQYGDAPVDTSGMTIEIAMDPKLQVAAEQAVQEGLRAVDKRQGFRGPQFKLDPDKLDAIRAALARKLATVAQTADQAWVLDLEGLHSAAVRKDVNKKSAAARAGKPGKGGKAKTADEAEESEPQDTSADDVDAGLVVLSPEVVARAAKARVLEQGSIYTGIVTGTSRSDAQVELAPGVTGGVPFATMAWARPFKPEHSTPAPQKVSDVLAVGDVVPVRVTRLQTTRDSATHLKVVRLELALEQTPKVQGAFVGMDLRTRGVLALVGGYDTALSSFNRATQAKRQPGSSFKPFLYAAALDSAKYTPMTRVDDSPEVITDPWSGKAWKPQNFEKDEFAGPVTLRRALAESKNTVAVKLLLDVGLDKVRAMARAAGLASEIPQSYTAALGTGEVGVLEEVNAYATLASQGRRADPVLIRKVVAADGNTLVNTTQPAWEQGVKAETAYLTADIMRSVIDDPAGTAHSLSALGRPAAGKTGTASEHRDGWFIGFTPSLIAGGWVGFDTHEMMGSLETGGHCAGPIWLAWMRAATAGQPREEWPPPPPGVTAVKVNRNTGALARDNDPYGVREVFIAGTEPTQAGEEEQQPGQEDWYQAPK